MKKKSCERDDSESLKVSANGNIVSCVPSLISVDEICCRAWLPDTESPQLLIMTAIYNVNIM